MQPGLHVQPGSRQGYVQERQVPDRGVPARENYRRLTGISRAPLRADPGRIPRRGNNNPDLTFDSYVSGPVVVVDQTIHHKADIGPRTLRHVRCCPTRFSVPALIMGIALVVLGLCIFPSDPVGGFVVAGIGLALGAAGVLSRSREEIHKEIYHAVKC